MKSAYKLTLLVFLLNFPLWGYGCEQEQAPETVEQQTDQEEENALARLKPEAAKEKQAVRFKKAGRGRKNGIEKTGESTEKISWIPGRKHRKILGY